jgi:anaphase-promoting complex subunit 3
MELFSTVLWHLKRDTDLSYLAQEVLTVDRLAPQVCWVSGHEAAPASMVV